MSTKNFVSNGDAETLFTGIGNKLSTLKSGLTTLDNEVNGDATVYPYADVITIPDAVPSNLADCTVKIEPVQDLHGYDHPWVGGANVNLMPQCVAGTYTSTNCTAVVSADGTITLSGTSGDSSESINIAIECEQTMPNQTLYAHLFNSFASGHVSVNFDKADGGAGASVGTPSVNRISEVNEAIQGLTVGKLRIWVAANTTITGTLRPMICTDSVAKPFSPYSNICPISGHTEASVQRDGVNLFKTAEEGGTYGGITYTINNDGSIAVSGKRTSSIGFPCGRANVRSSFGNVTISCNIISGLTLAAIKYMDASDNELGRTTTFIQDEQIQYRTIDISAFPTVAYIEVIMKGTADGVTVEGVLTIKVETGTKATAWEPYAGKTYTIALGDTYYKGLLDVDTGVFTSYNVKRLLNDPDKWISTSGNIVYKYDEAFSDRKQHTEDSYTGVFTSFITIDQLSLYTGRWQSSHLNYFGIRDDNSLITLEQLKTMASAGNLQICYELATPTTIQLTPQQIQLLKGQNTLTASTGQISVTVNGVSGSIGAVQEQVNELAEDVAEQLPTAPTTDGTYSLQVTVASGVPTYSWVSGS